MVCGIVVCVWRSQKKNNYELVSLRKCVRDSYLKYISLFFTFRAMRFVFALCFSVGVLFLLLFCLCCGCCEIEMGSEHQSQMEGVFQGTGERIMKCVGSPNSCALFCHYFCYIHVNIT